MSEPRIDSSFSSITKMNIGRFRRAVDVIFRSGRNKSIMLKGVHGVGKSSIVRQLSEERAEKLGLQFVEFKDLDPNSILALLPGSKVAREEDFSDGGEHYAPAEANGLVWFDPTKHFVFYDIRLGQRDYVDFVGSIDKSSGVTRFVPVDWVVLCACPELKGTLFFDELDQAPKMVMNAAFEIVHDRRINTHAMSEHVSIFAAGNSGIGATIYSAKPLSAALNDRFWTIHLVPSKDEWIEWCSGVGTSGHDVLARFMKTDNGQGFLDYPLDRRAEQDAVLPSRRSWGDFAYALSVELDDAGFDRAVAFDDFNDVDAASPTGSAFDLSEETVVKIPDAFGNEQFETVSDVLKGYVGEEAADAFIGWLRDSRPALSLDEVLNGDYDPNNLPSAPTIITIYRAALRNIDRFADRREDESGEDFYVPNADARRLGAFFEEVYEEHQEVGAVLTSMTVNAMLNDQGRVKMYKSLIAKGGATYSNKSEESGPLEHVMARSQDTAETADDEEGFFNYTPKFSEHAKRVRAEKKRQWTERKDREAREQEAAMRRKEIALEEAAVRISAAAAAADSPSESESAVTFTPASSVADPDPLADIREFCDGYHGPEEDWPSDWKSFTNDPSDYGFMVYESTSSGEPVVRFEVNPLSLTCLHDWNLNNMIVNKVVKPVLPCGEVMESTYEPDNEFLTMDAVKATLSGLGFQEVTSWI